MKAWFASILIALAIPTTAQANTAVVTIHGGGWWSGAPTRVSPICEEVASAGLPCFTPDYTLSMSAPYPRANRDLARFVADLRAQGYDQIFAVGASAGGNLAAWLASRGLVEGYVTWSAPSDLRRIDWKRPIPGWVVHRFAPKKWKRYAASPALRTITVPGLIFHSRDEWIPVGQARRLRRATPNGTLRVLSGSAHAMSYFDRAITPTVNWLLAHTGDDTE